MKEQKCMQIGNQQDSYLRYTLLDREELDKMTRDEKGQDDFVISDICKSMNPDISTKALILPDLMVRIDELHVNETERNKGLASAALQYLCARYANAFIFIRSEPLKVDYPKRPDDKTHNQELINQAKFLEKRNFRKFNSLCGLEYGIPYLYLNDNDIAKYFYSLILNLEIDPS